MTQTNKDQTTQPNALKPVQELLAKEVNRKEFLKITGLSALVLVGLGPILHFLTGKGTPHRITTITKSTGSVTAYSRGSYNK